MNTKTAFVLVICALELLSLVTACHRCNLGRKRISHRRPKCHRHQPRKYIQNVEILPNYQNRVRYYYPSEPYNQAISGCSGNVQNEQLLVPVNSGLDQGFSGYVSGQGYLPGIGSLGGSVGYSSGEVFVSGSLGVNTQYQSNNVVTDVESVSIESYESNAQVDPNLQVVLVPQTVQPRVYQPLSSAISSNLVYPTPTCGCSICSAGGCCGKRK